MGPSTNAHYHACHRWRFIYINSFSCSLTPHRETFVSKISFPRVSCPQILPQLQWLEFILSTDPAVPGQTSENLGDRHMPFEWGSNSYKREFLTLSDVSASSKNVFIKRHSTLYKDLYNIFTAVNNTNISEDSSFQCQASCNNKFISRGRMSTQKLFASYRNQSV